MNEDCEPSSPNDLYITEDVPGVVAYFRSRLQEMIQKYNGVVSVLDEWRIDILKKDVGAFAGTIEVNYVWATSTGAKAGKIAKSRVEVGVALGLTSGFKLISRMSREQMFDMSVETREKMLISQRLQLSGFRCSEVIVKGEDFMVMFENTKIDQNYFACGNFTVLDWGKIYPEKDSFHDLDQLYPIGFKAVRREHDSVLDTVVDCLCEIVESSEERDGEVFSIPLFRITVGWVLGSKDSEDFESVRKVVKVYEGRTPQQAWQGVMLEQIGVNGDDDDADTLIECDMQVEDDEERGLRASLWEARKSYFKKVKAAQASGGCGAMTSRLLTVEILSSFYDDGIMRLIEGMSGAFDCSDYVFMDKRIHDGGRKHFLRAFSKSAQLYKFLKKIERKFSSGLDKIKFEKVKKTSSKNGISGTGARKRISLVTAQKQKLKDVDRLARQIKEGAVRECRRMREVMKVTAEEYCYSEFESDFKDIAGNEYSLIMNRDSERQRSTDNFPVLEGIYLPGDTFGSVLELWGFLAVYFESLKLTMIPNVDYLVGVFHAVDPITVKIRNLSLKLSNSLEQTKRIKCNEGMSSEDQKHTMWFHHLPSSEAEFVLNRIGVAMCKSLEAEYKYIVSKEFNVEGVVPLDVMLPINEITWREVVRVVLLYTCYRELGASEDDTILAIRGKSYSNTNDRVDAADRKLGKLMKQRVLFAHTEQIENREAMLASTACGGVCSRIPAPCYPLTGETIWDEGYSVLIECLSLLNTSEVRGNSLIAHELLSVLVTCVEHLLSLYRLSSNVNEFAGVSETLQAIRLCCTNILSSDCAHDLTVLSDSVNTVVKLFGPIPSNKTIAQPFDTKIKQYYNLGNASSAGSKLKEVPTAPTIEESYESQVPMDEDMTEAASQMNEQFDIDIGYEAQRLPSLSVAAQRCYIVLRDLMTSFHSAALNFPVNPAIYNGYYESILRPLSFYDIRIHLIAGGYENNISGFYSDIIVVIENALAFNADGSTIAVSAHKLRIMFERMFLETVLCWDFPLSRGDCCPVCRSADSGEDVNNADENPEHDDGYRGKIKCDRCDGSFHMHCVDADMLASYNACKMDWICGNCIESKSIPHVHPYRMAKLRNPDPGDSDCGEVVGIEADKCTLQFVVGFKNNTRRSIWKSEQIHENLLDQEVEWPSGYTQSDYDNVCGLARGYGGWNSCSTHTPPFVSAENTRTSKELSNENVDFALYMKALEIMSTSHGYTSSASTLAPLASWEWLTIFSALKAKLLSSPILQDAMSGVDTSTVREVVQNEISRGVSGSRKSGKSVLQTLMNKSSKIKIGFDTNTLDEQEIDDITSPPTAAALSTKIVVPSKPVSLNVLLENAKFTDKEFDAALNSDSISDSDDSGEDNGESYEEWELRKISRWKGYEDALITKNALPEAIAIINEQDADDIAKISEYDELSAIALTVKANTIITPANIAFGYEEGLDSVKTPGMSCVAKAMVARTPAPPVVQNAWCSAYVSGLSSVCSNNSQLAVCEICQLSEAQLCSPFVSGCTLDEWKSQILKKFLYEKGNIDSFLVNICESDLVSGLLTNKQGVECCKPVWWQPISADLRDIEMAEYAIGENSYGEAFIQNSAFVRLNGSSIVHECCANLSHSCRVQCLIEKKRMMFSDIVETMAFISSGRVASIGCDCSNRTYYYVPNVKCIYIKLPDKSATGRDEVNMDGLSLPYDISKDNGNLEYREGSSLWIKVSDIGDVRKIYDSFSATVLCEAKLKILLQLLFPSVVLDTCAVENKKTNNSSSFDISSVVLPLKKPILNLKSLPDQVNDYVNEDPVPAPIGVVDVNKVEHSVGDTVLVKFGAYDLLYEGVIAGIALHDIEIDVFAQSVEGKQQDSDKKNIYYLIQYSDWRCGGNYTAWVARNRVFPNTITRVAMATLKWTRFRKDSVASAPYLLSNLNAAQHLNAPGRHHSLCPFEFQFSNCWVSGSSRDMFYQLKYGLLMIYHSLPFGAIDDVRDDKWGLEHGKKSEERVKGNRALSDHDIWGDSFDWVSPSADLGSPILGEAWREAVISANDVQSLMVCQLLLESGIRNSAYASLGVRLMNLLPSKQHSLRQASCALIGMRLFALDSVLKYSSSVAEDCVAVGEQSRKKRKCNSS